MYQNVLSFLRLFFPALCPGCGNDLAIGEEEVCLHCVRQLVTIGQTGMLEIPVERLLPPGYECRMAYAMHFYGQGQIIQQLLHAVKYRKQHRLGVWLGKRLGEELLSRFAPPSNSVIVPVPLHPAKKAARGFNQAEIIGIGISRAAGLPLIADGLCRHKRTTTQTRKSRESRWENMQDAFAVPDPGRLRGKSILLVDDVVTTGATLLACVDALKREACSDISIAAVAVAAEI